MAQRREPGVLVLAKELSASIEKHVEDREYSPTYLISEIGAKVVSNSSSSVENGSLKKSRSMKGILFWERNSLPLRQPCHLGHQ